MASWFERLLSGRSGAGRGRGVRGEVRPPVGSFKSVSLGEDVGGIVACGRTYGVANAVISLAYKVRL